MPTILVIDDDSDLREMMQFLLSQLECEVVLAPNGLEGVRLAWQHHPDVILLDVMMPMMDGHQVLQRLKLAPETAGIPVVMLTAVSMARQVRALLEAGACDYVVKPFEAHALLDRVTRVLARSRRLGAGGRLTFVVAQPPDSDLGLLGRYLEIYGSISDTASGAEALGLVLERPPSAVFLAPELEDLDGLTVLQRLRQSGAAAKTYAVALVPAVQYERERLRLLGAGFDQVLALPPTREAVNAVVERAALPRSTFTRIEDGVVVLAVVAVDGAATIQRLRDALVDLLAANLSRFIIDLSHGASAGAVLASLRPLLDHLAAKGLAVRIVATGAAIDRALEGFDRPPPLFPSLEAAFEGWR